MIHVGDLRELVIRPACRMLDMYSEEAEELVLGTALVESTVGNRTRLKQTRGPALGIFQMEPLTHDDIWKNYIGARPHISDALRWMCPNAFWHSEDHRPVPELLTHNLLYAAAMCRVHYYRKPERLPMPGDWMGHARYWKKAYNTPSGKGTVEKFLAACYKVKLIKDLEINS